jgi:hypothetical protein
MTFIRVSKIYLIIIFCLIIQHSVFGQEEFSSDTLDVNEYDEGYYQVNDSVDNVFPDYYRVTISPVHSRVDNMKLSSYSNKYYLNINYSYSIFPQPLEYIPTQFGLYSEIGLNNTSVYFNIGPELMIVRHIYLIPYTGITLIPFPKNNNEDVTITYYAGAAAGCIINLNQDIDIIFEAASDFMKFKQDRNNSYLKVGISYNLFYPL